MNSEESARDSLVPAAPRVTASVKSTLTGLSPPMAPPPAAPVGSVKSTLTGMASPALERAANESGAHGALASGAVFEGRYKVARVVGVGRLGVVYAAEGVADGRERALKVLRAVTGDGAAVDARVEADLRAASAATSDHVAAVIDVGRTGQGALWFAGELLQGVTLAQRADPTAREALSRRDAWRVLLHVAAGLEALHDAGVVHRDLRPSNVFLATQRSGGFRAKILDPGLGHRVEWDRAQGGPDVGAAWSAPECAPGAAVTPGADFWSFGLMAFWLFTGRSYWPTGRARLDAPLVAASERCAELALARKLPDGFDAWFEQCVARTHHDRFDAARSLSRALLAMFRASPDGGLDDGFVPPVIVADGVRTSSPSVARVESADTSARHTTRLPPPIAASIAPAAAAPRDDGLLDDDDVRVVPPSASMTPDEARDAAEAMRATRDSLPLSLVFEAPASAAATGPRTAITAPFPVLRASEADDALELATAAMLRESVIEAAPETAPTSAPQGSSVPPARYTLPLVSTRRMPSIRPGAVRAAQFAGVLFAGACGVIATAWIVASSEAPAPVSVAAPTARVAPAPIVAAPVAPAPSAPAPAAPIAVAPVAPAAAIVAAPVTAAAPSVAPTSNATMHGWADESIRAWAGALELRHARYGFTLALRRRHRFMVAGFFVWDLDGAQVRESVAGTYDPSSGLLRVHGTSSSDPLRMPVGAYALHVTRAGELDGSTMIHASRLTGRLDDAAAARVSTFLLPASPSGSAVTTAAGRRASPPSRP